MTSIQDVLKCADNKDEWSILSVDDILQDCSTTEFGLPGQGEREGEKRMSWREGGKTVMGITQGSMVRRKVSSTRGVEHEVCFLCAPTQQPKHNIDSCAGTPKQCFAMSMWLLNPGHRGTSMHNEGRKGATGEGGSRQSAALAGRKAGKQERFRKAGLPQDARWQEAEQEGTHPCTTVVEPKR